MSVEKFKEMLASAVEGVQAAAPGLSLDAVLKDVGAELKQQAAFGAHELASAMFNGSAFVMYPRQGQEDQQQGVDQATQALPQQEQSRAGMSM